MAEHMKRTSIMVRDGLWREVKIRALTEGREIQELVAEALSEYLRKHSGGGFKQLVEEVVARQIKKGGKS